MNLFHRIRQRLHPLHALRRSGLFQFASRHFDPMIRRRVPILGYPIYVRLLSHASLMVDDATQETSILETFSAILKCMPPDRAPIFWDVGANIGLYTWQCALARPDSQIVSFEPDPKNLRCLERTNSAWALSHHTIMARAVAEQSGRAGFCVDDLAGATGTLQCDEESFNQRHYGMAPRKIEVETIALDDFVRDRPPPDVIKIDVEGAELRVVRGAANLLAQHRPVLFFESFEHGADIVEQLRPLGYMAWDSDERSDITPQTVNFIAFVPDVRPAVGAVLARLAYPIHRECCPN